MLRGQIYFVDLGPVIGREIDGLKRRPIVVLSIDDLNRKPLVITIVPGTSTPNPYLNAAKVIPSQQNGLRVETYFLGHQIKALDHSRFTSPPVGRLSTSEMSSVEAAVRFSLGLQ